MFYYSRQQEIRSSMPLFLYGASYQEHLEVAQKLHEHSFFASGAFIEASLTRIPRALRYQKLFGAVLEESASSEFSDLEGEREEKSWLLQAQGGTLFIDEIDALTAEMQYKILKLIGYEAYAQEKEPLEVLEEEEKERGSFRIIFASQYSVSLLTTMHCLLPDFIKWLTSLSGKHALGAERVRAIKDIAFSEQKTNLQGLGHALEPILENYVHAGLKTKSYDLYATLMGEVERPLIKMALRYTGGNQLKTASLLGVNRNTLRKRIKELGIEIPQKGERS